MRTLAVIIVVSSLPGCTILDTNALRVNFLCNKQPIIRDGYSLHFNDEEGLRHIHCDKKRPLSFSYAFGG